VALGWLPSVNAGLNALAALALLAGYVAIRRRRRDLHRVAMVSAVGLSGLFLVSYLVYHWQVGSRRFPGEGAMRALYLAILLSHTVLAAAVPPLVALTLRRALRGELARHARLARWTLPVWLYVSVTGVVVYWMLYHGAAR
jgi:MYXO-CTERM domain-containing protein